MPGSELDFQHGGNARAYLLEGWSSPEPWGTWSVGDDASICLPLEKPLGGAATLTVLLQPFVNPKHPVAKAQVLYFGAQIAEWTFDCPGSVEKQIALPRELVSSDRNPVFVFRVQNPVSPLEIGLSTDPRPLGLGFVRLRLKLA